MIASTHGLPGNIRLVIQSYANLTAGDSRGLAGMPGKEKR
jgi:hypothetical protein